MDEEFLKRSTDCVYFLASPLTCKKGIECEYRHSEIARLNPRDCWYWLSGSCLNPGCAFRHPPLDTGAEVTSEVNLSQNQSVATSSKVNVPCYFFFNGTCNKGDRCGFSHGPDDNTPARKSLKTPSTTVDAISSQMRKNPETNIEQSNSRQVVEVPMQTRVIIPTKEDVRLTVVPTNNFTFNIPLQTHEEECGEPRLKELLRPAPICVNQSSLDHQSPRDHGGDGHIDGEDRLESSPGFDVLVDNESDDVEYEDEQEYVLGLDRGLDGDGRELNGQYVRYDYEEPIEYDPEYPHMGNNSREDKIRDSYPQINDDNEYVGGRRARERLSAPIFTRKRKNFPTDYPSDDRTVDLRYHLENRKQTNGGSPRQFVRRHNNNGPHLHRFGYENRSGSRRHQQQQQTTWRPQRKSIEEGVEDSWDRGGGGGGYRKNRHYNNNNSNVRGGGGQDLNVENYISSEGSGVPWKRRLGERSDLFTRPKTLAEIREEKDKVIGGSTTTTMMVCEDFEAPKPLSEILKDKNRLASVVEVKDNGGGNENGNGSR